MRKQHKTVLIIAILGILAGCTNAPKGEEIRYEKDKNIKIDGRILYTYIIDGCEYIGNTDGNGAILTHKGNCKNHKK